MARTEVSIKSSTFLNSEEEHYDWFETQIELFDKVGEKNHLQSMM